MVDLSILAKKVDSWSNSWMRKLVYENSRQIILKPLTNCLQPF